MTIQTTFANPDDFDDSKQHLGEIIRQLNEQAAAAGGSPVFEAYDLAHDLDIQDWQDFPGLSPTYMHDGTVDIPAHRVRVIGEKGGKLIYACYSKEFAPIDSEDIAEIARQAHSQSFRWKITYKQNTWGECTCTTAKLTNVGSGVMYHAACGRARASRVEGSIAEHVNNLQLQAMSDDDYNGYYPTIPGQDVAHYNANAVGMDSHRGGSTLMGDHAYDNDNRIIEDRQEIRGGTEIRGGRSEHREKTKGLVQWDKGFQAHVDRLKAEKAEKLKQQNREKVANLVNKGPEKPFRL